MREKPDFDTADLMAISIALEVHIAKLTEQMHAAQANGRGEMILFLKVLHAGARKTYRKVLNGLEY